MARRDLKIPRPKLGPKAREVELEGRVYRVVTAPKRLKDPVSVVVKRSDGHRYRGGAPLCTGRSRQRFNPRDFRAELGDGVDPALLELDAWTFKELADDYDPRHFAMCERQPRKGRDRCKFHGGNHLVGAANPNAGDLSTSAYAVEGRVGRYVDAFLAGLPPEDLTEEIALYRGLLKDSIGPALRDGESLPVFRTLRRLASDLRAAARDEDAERTLEVAAELRALSNGDGRAKAAAELTKHGKALAGLVRVQVQRRRALDEIVTPHDLDAFEARVVGAMRRMVKAVTEELPEDHPARSALRMALSEAQREIASARPQVLEIGGG